MMSKNFRERVIYERIVDTKLYRYITVDRHNATEQWREIHRIPLSDLDTTAAINGWETVWDSRMSKS